MGGVEQFPPTHFFSFLFYFLLILMRLSFDRHRENTADPPPFLSPFSPPNQTSFPLLFSHIFNSSFSILSKIHPTIGGACKTILLRDFNYLYTMISLYQCWSLLLLLCCAPVGEFYPYLYTNSWVSSTLALFKLLWYINLHPTLFPLTIFFSFWHILLQKRLQLLSPFPIR